MVLQTPAFVVSVSVFLYGLSVGLCVWSHCHCQSVSVVLLSVCLCGLSVVSLTAYVDSLTVYPFGFTDGLPL